MIPTVLQQKIQSPGVSPRTAQSVAPLLSPMDHHQCTGTMSSSSSTRELSLAEVQGEVTTYIES